MSTEKRIEELELRTQEHELKQASLVAVEKNNKKWILGISAIVFALLGISYVQLPALVLQRVTAIVDTKIDSEAQERLNTLLAEAEEIAGRIQVNGAQADQKTRRLRVLENQAIALIRELKQRNGLVQQVDNVDGNSTVAPTMTAAAKDDLTKQHKWITLFDNYYAKKGYYLPFGDTLKINVSSVENNKVDLSINSANNDFKQESTLAPESVIFIEYRAVEYQIILNKVDRAGFNPLTKAAYFKVRQKSTSESED